MNTDITAFITARLDEDDEVAAFAAKTRSGRPGGNWKVDCDCMGLCTNYCDARRVEGDNITIYDEGGHGNYQAQHIARHDPARVLVEVAAKRRRLERHRPETTEYYDRHGNIATFTACEICGNGGTTDDAWPCIELLDDAAPYAGQPGYDESWRP